VHKKYAHNSELLQHVMNPSLKVDDRFAAWIAVTSTGRVMNGLLDSQTDEAVVLRTADRQLVSLARSEIEELQKTPRSLMPDGVLADLTAQEAADLIAFIRAQPVTEAPASP
jgi:putative heme-binding domain-containing protein